MSYAPMTTSKSRARTPTTDRCGRLDRGQRRRLTTAAARQRAPAEERRYDWLTPFLSDQRRHQPSKVLEPRDLAGATVVERLAEAKRVVADHCRRVLDLAEAGLVERAQQEVHVGAVDPGRAAGGTAEPTPAAHLGDRGQRYDRQRRCHRADRAVTGRHVLAVPQDQSAAVADDDLLPDAVDLVDEAFQREAQHGRAAEHAAQRVERDVRVAQVGAGRRVKVLVRRPVREHRGQITAAVRDHLSTYLSWLA